MPSQFLACLCPIQFVVKAAIKQARGFGSSLELDVSASHDSRGLRRRKRHTVVMPDSLWHASTSKQDLHLSAAETQLLTDGRSEDSLAVCKFYAAKLRLSIMLLFLLCH